MKVRFLVLVMAILAPLAISQDLTAQTTWWKAFGGDQEYYGPCIALTDDGGCLAVGQISSIGAGGKDALLVRLDRHGQLLWSKTFGGPGDDRVQSVTKTDDGGFVLVGSALATGETWPGTWVARLDGGGNLMWQRIESSGKGDLANAVKQMKDGSLAVVGTIGLSGVFLAKYDTGGNLAWRKIFATSQLFDTLSSIDQTADGGYVACGTTYDGGSNRGWVVRFSAKGKIVWQKTYLALARSSFNALRVTSDGGLLAVGSMNTWTGEGRACNQDMLLVKMTAAGEVVWALEIGQETVLGGDSATSAVETREGDYVVCGWSDSFPVGAYDRTILIKLAPAGQVVWQRIYGASMVHGGCTSDDSPYGVAQATDGSLFVALRRAQAEPDGTCSEELGVCRLAEDGAMDPSCTMAADLTEDPQVPSLSTSLWSSTYKTSKLALQTSGPVLETCTPYEGVVCSGPALCELSCQASALKAAKKAVQVPFLGQVESWGCTQDLNPRWDFGDGSPLAVGQNVQHAFAASGTYNWTFTASSEGTTCSRTGTVTVVDTLPGVTGVSKSGDPFKLSIAGSGFQPRLSILIGGQPWSKASLSSASLLKVTGGLTLKALFPKGVFVPITIINPDGGQVTIGYDSGTNTWKLES